MKNFFKQVGATLVGLLLFSLFIIAILSNSVIRNLRKASSTPVIHQHGTKQKILHIKLEDRLTEEKTSLLSSSTSFTDLVYGLEHAATNPTIQGLFIEIAPDFSTSYAYLEAIGKALEDFKQSKKPIAVYSETYSLPLLSTFAGANIISINPTGSASLQGPSTSLLYYRELLNKLSINPIVYQSAENKTFGERFTHTSPRPETKERLHKLLSQFYDYSITTLSNQRKISKETIGELNKTYAYLTPLQGKQVGIIDTIGHREDLLEQLTSLTTNNDQAPNKTKEGSPEKQEDNNAPRKLSTVDLSTYNAKHPPKKTKTNKLVIIPLEGDIIEGETSSGKIGGSDTVALIQQYANDPIYKAIILIVNSPGGSLTASEKIRHAIALATKKKPIIALVRSMAASGGYYIIMDSSHIIAQKTSIIGSIGVIAMHFEISKLIKRLGIHAETIKTTRYSSLSNMYAPPTDEERASGQEHINYLNQFYRLQLIKARGLDPKKLETFADGRIFLTPQAIEYGLVDDTGYLPQAIEKAATLARLQPNTYSITYHEKAIKIKDLLRSLATS